MNAPDQSDDLAVAVELLSRGAAVAVPTDTQYALSAVATDADAVAEVFRLKRRPGFENLPVLIPSLDWLDRIAAPLEGRVRLLAERAWPGAVTLIVTKREDFATAAVTGETIALRIPDHPVALELLARLDAPLTGTSANLHGEPAALTPDDVREQLGGAVHIVGYGSVAPAGSPSTILDCSGRVPRVLRSGASLRPDIGDLLIQHWGLPDPDAAGA